MNFENVQTDDDQGTPVMSDNFVSQSFVCLYDHFITAVTLPLYRVGATTPGTLTLAIRAADGSELPTGSENGEPGYLHGMSHPVIDWRRER